MLNVEKDLSKQAIFYNKNLPFAVDATVGLQILKPWKIDPTSAVVVAVLLESVAVAVEPPKIDVGEATDPKENLISK